MKKDRENSFLARCAYGAADIYGGGAFVVIGTFFTVFLTKALGMPPALAGSIPLIGKVWDAVTDPVMGNITDRTRSRFGAKRFYILIGSFISAITFILMWVPLPQAEMGLKYIFVPILLCVITIFFTAKFPMNKEEFAVIRREIARRRGEDDSAPTSEEIAVCEKVTGFAFSRLWGRDNALKM